MTSSQSMRILDEGNHYIPETTRLNLTLRFRDSHSLSQFDEQETLCKSCQRLPKLPNGQRYGCQTCYTIQYHKAAIERAQTQKLEPMAPHGTTSTQLPLRHRNPFQVSSNLPVTLSGIDQDHPAKANSPPMSPARSSSNGCETSAHRDVLEDFDFDSFLSRESEQSACNFGNFAAPEHCDGLENFDFDSFLNREPTDCGPDPGPQEFSSSLPALGPSVPSAVTHCVTNSVSNSPLEIEDHQDQQSQLALLEEQNKKRLMLAGQQRAQQFHAYPDYQMQLMLLEQQNKKRLELANKEKSRALYAEQHHQMQLMLLEQQTKKRLLFSRHGQDNIERPASKKQEIIQKSAKSVSGKSNTISDEREKSTLQGHQALLVALEKQKRAGQQELPMPAHLKDAISRNPALQEFLALLRQEKSAEMGEMARKLQHNLPISRRGPFRSYAGGNSPGEDYQMQLILLEHQKKMGALREAMENERLQIHQGLGEEETLQSPMCSSDSDEDSDGDSEMLDESHQREFERQQSSFQAKMNTTLPALGAPSTGYVQQLEGLEQENKRRLAAEQQHSQDDVWPTNLLQDVQRQSHREGDTADVSGSRHMAEAYRRFYSQLQR